MATRPTFQFHTHTYRRSKFQYASVIYCVHAMLIFVPSHSSFLITRFLQFFSVSLILQNLFFVSDNAKHLLQAYLAEC